MASIVFNSLGKNGTSKTPEKKSKITFSSLSGDPTINKVYPKPEAPKSTISKIGGAVKDVAKEVASSAVTVPARIPQAVASFAGASNEDINRVSSKLSGGLIAPVPESGADVMKDVGRAVETASFGIPGSTAVKIAAGGAVSGLGTSMRQGNDILSKETALNVGAGAAFGYGLGKVLPKVMPKFSNKVSIEENKVVGDAVEATTPKTVVAKFGEENKIPVTTRGKGEIVIPKASPKPLQFRDAALSLEQQGYSKGQLSAVFGKYTDTYGGTSKYVPEKLYKIAQEMVPENPSQIVSTATIKDNKNFTGVVKPLAGEIKFPEPQPTRPSKLLSETQAKPVQPKLTETTQVAEKQAILDKIDSIESDVPLIERQTNRAQREAALSESWDDVERVVRGEKAPVQGSNKQAYLSVLEHEADMRAAKGDTALLRRISRMNYAANVSREAGQSLQALASGKGTTARLVSELKFKILDKKVPGVFKKDIMGFQKEEIANFKKEYQKLLEEASNVRPTKKDIAEVLNSIICK